MASFPVMLFCRKIPLTRPQFPCSLTLIVSAKPVMSGLPVPLVSIVSQLLLELQFYPSSKFWNHFFGQRSINCSHLQNWSNFWDCWSPLTTGSGLHSLLKSLLGRLLWCDRLLTGKLLFTLLLSLLQVKDLNSLKSSLQLLCFASKWGVSAFSQESSSVYSARSPILPICMLELSLQRIVGTPKVVVV